MYARTRRGGNRWRRLPAGLCSVFRFVYVTLQPQQQSLIKGNLLLKNNLNEVTAANCQGSLINFSPTIAYRSISRSHLRMRFSTLLPGFVVFLINNQATSGQSINGRFPCPEEYPAHFCGRETTPQEHATTPYVGYLQPPKWLGNYYTCVGVIAQKKPAKFQFCCKNNAFGNRSVYNVGITAEDLAEKRCI
ncbi:hypothetical protein PGT21_032923 [Puccinia graminis f. sp. tritici]|uniref:Uncharacterized protein n=1 Tax=Puccinia graminis f. sp. tritici TaxID=56615 RepID=A0A5B0N763_PUCGR|nr:hypothetical protein PGT21_032923 [Puccinia graminis f. sp. tritici]